VSNAGASCPVAAATRALQQRLTSAGGGFLLRLAQVGEVTW